MSSKTKESESDEEEDEAAADGGPGKKIGSSAPSQNVTYLGGIKLSDAKRTTLAYVSAVFSLTGLILAILIFISGLREDSYLSDFSDMVKGYSGGGIFTMMMAVGVAAGVIQLLGCHICFRVTISIERRKLYYWIWVYMMALLGLFVAFLVANVVALMYWLTAHSAFKGGMHDALKLYESRLKVKTSIDRMQIDFECCGSDGYEDWWHVGWWSVRWLDTNSRQVQEKMKDGRTYLTDSVPFSCCDPRVRRPCVHHSMQNSFQHTKYDASNVTVYETGCTRAMSKHYASTVTTFLELLGAALGVELALTVTFRYLQTSTGAAIEQGEMDAETRGYLWTVASKSKEPQPEAAKAKSSPPKPDVVGKGGKPGTSKKGPSKPEVDENRNNVAPNNNTRRPVASNHSTMAVRPKDKQAAGSTVQPRTDRSGTRTTRRQTAPPTVSRLPSTATVTTSRQTSATGSTRNTYDTHVTAPTPRDSNVSMRTGDALSASRQQSQNSVATSQLAPTTSGRRTSAGSGSYARRSSSHNVNVNAAPDGSSQTSGSTVHQSASDVTNAGTHQAYSQQLSPQLVSHCSPRTIHVTHSDVEPTQKAEVPRPLTPIPPPECHYGPVSLRSTTRLPRSIPLADFLGSPRLRGQPYQTGSTSDNLRSCSRGVLLQDRTTGCGGNMAATQAPLAAVHRPVGLTEMMADIHRPATERRVEVPTLCTVPPSLPSRNVVTADDSPYVMMYPLRPPRAGQPL